MRPLLKFAWVELTMVAVIAISVLIQYIVKGVFEISPAGIALFTAGIFVFKYSKAKVIQDERDVEIERQANTAALLAVFIYFIAAGAYVILDLDQKPIGHGAFVNFFCSGFTLYFLVLSLVIIVLFGQEKETTGGWLESLGEMSGLQKESLSVLSIIAALLILALLRFPVSDSTPFDIALGTALLLVPVVAFFLFPFFIHTGRAYDYYRPVINRARRTMLWSAAVGMTIGLLVIAAMYLLKGPEAIYLNLFLVSGYCAISLGVLVFLACLLVSPAKPEVIRQ
jgi:hypothetical protein